MFTLRAKGQHAGKMKRIKILIFHRNRYNLFYHNYNSRDLIFNLNNNNSAQIYFVKIDIFAFKINKFFQTQNAYHF